MKYTELLNVRLTKEQMDALRAIADREYTSMTEVARDLIIARIRRM